MKTPFTLLASLLLLLMLSVSCTEPAEEAHQDTMPDIPAKSVDQTQPDVPPVPRVEWANILFEETKKDFGTVEQNVPAKHRFTFKNVGKVDLKLENVKPSCSCTASDYTKEAIPPGGTGFVEAEFNAKSPGQFTKTISVVSNSEQRTTILTLAGEVQAAE